MGKDIKTILNECYEMCDYIEENGIVKDDIKTSLRENLKIEFINFVVYLAMANGSLLSAEQKFIKDVFDYDIDQSKGMALKVKNDLFETKYGSRIPLVMKYFVLTDAGRKIKNDKYKYKKANKLSKAFRELGQNYIANSDLVGNAEVDLLSKYCVMLDNYLRDYGLLIQDKRRIKVTDNSVYKNNVESSAEEPVESSADEQVEPLADELMEELNSLTGLKSVKEDVNALINLMKVQKMREEMGMKQVSVNKHLVFMGNPGTGKTTVARLLGKIYAAIGVVETGQLVEVDRSGLVSGYIGQTATKVMDVVDEALGGILFIDEAYALTNKKGEGDFGTEAVDTLLKAMEDHRDDLIVIVAGYTDLMEDFLESNPGLKSRFNKFIFFEDYTAEEELEILMSMSKKQEYRFDDKAREEAKRFFEERCANKTETYANARDVRNYLEKAITNQAGRIVEESGFKNLSKDELSLIKYEDVVNIKLDTR